MAAAAYTTDGDLLAIVDIGPFCDAASLCGETGVILEAHRRATGIASIACVTRVAAGSPALVLSPCGICQERLFDWGLGVEVAVPRADDPTRWGAKTLGDLQPHHVSEAFTEARRE